MAEETMPAGRRVLLVEDDPEAADYVLHVLRGRGGFEVTHVAGPGRRPAAGPAAGAGTWC